MRIQQITNQHRRDFTAIYECEHCHDTVNGRGYDDERFHTRVIPTMECNKCGKTAGENYRPLTTKYPEGMQISAANSKWT